MIIYVQLILVAILLIILIFLYTEERRKEKAQTSRGKITQFWDGSERRRFVRIDADIPITYTLSKKLNDIKNAKTKNISVGGICAVVSEKLNPNLGLLLQIEFPGSPHPISAKGEVVRVSEESNQRNTDGIRYFTVGIEFKEISPKDKERILNFIKQSGCSG